MFLEGYSYVLGRVRTFIFETYLPNSLMICNACDLKNLENDMVLLGKKKNQPQEKYSKMYKNILDDVLADIQDVQGPYIIEKAGQSRMVIVNLANELLPPLPNGTITLPSSTNVSVKSSPEISAREKLLTDKPAAFWNGPSSCCDSGLHYGELGSQTSVVFRFIVRVELMTHDFSQYFLLLALIANIGKKISLACYLAVGSFAVADNLVYCFRFKMLENLDLLLTATLNVMVKNNQRFIFETYLPNSLMICNTCDLKIYLYGGYSKEVSSDKNNLEKGIVHHDMWILDHKTWVWNKVFMLLLTLAFTFRPGPRAGFSYVGQIDMTNFRRDGLENGTVGY
ncbi:hypothetical protein Tco_0541510 [Tanacetum coccineum]